jgi:hypothetical protein
MPARTALVAAFATLLLAPAGASAATAALTTGAVSYRADPGETNVPSVALSVDRRTLTIRDDGAAMATGDGCTPAGEHEARCAVPDATQIAVRIDLGDGNDVLTGVTLLGADVEIDAGPGDDHVEARVADVQGGEGADLIEASGTIDGGPGDDVLRGGFASDQLAGGPGRDTIDGGPGSDTVSWADETRPVTIDLETPGPAGPAQEPDEVRNVESVTGGAGDDRLLGDDGFNSLVGGPGDDVLDGRGGGDWLDGGRGADTLIGGAGRDRLIATDLGNDSADLLDGGPDGDWIKSGSAGSVVIGGGGPDEISFAARVRRVDAGAGADYLEQTSFYGAEAARIRCGDGVDRLRGVPGSTPIPRDCDIAVVTDSSIEVATELRLRGRSLTVPLPRDCVLGTCELRVDVLADGRRIGRRHVLLLRAFPTTTTLHLARPTLRRLKRARAVTLAFRLDDPDLDYRVTVRPPRARSRSEQS